MTPAVDTSQHFNPLAAHYRRFRVDQRMLLSGHSHQAWPDVAFEGQQRAWLDAADHVDGKWERAFATADRVRQGYARLLDDPGADIALAESTFALIVRWLSALPLRERPVLLTTEGEFHTIRRLLDRLGEEGLEIRKEPAFPVEDLAARLAARVDGRTAAVLVSAVLYQSSRIVPGLEALAAACEREGSALLVDAYHAVNVMEFPVRALGLETAYVTGAGYKYCQLGEGNGFLRLPPGCRLRPAVTGWFAEFGDLARDARDTRVPYGPGGQRFAGATYDPTSHYRAAAVFDFFLDQRLDPRALRAISQHQVGRLMAGFDALDLDPRLIDRDRTVELTALGGFLVLDAPRAGEICRSLRERGVWTDHRGHALRLGPAPYLSDRQLDEAVAILGEVVTNLD